MGGIEVGQIQPGEARHVARIHDAAFAPCLRDLGPLYGWRPIGADDVGAWSAEAGTEVWVGRRDGVPVAYAHCATEGKGDARSIWLVEPAEGLAQSGLAVDPACQRQGIATSLLTTLLDHYETEGAARLCGLSYSDNPAASALARRHGFWHGGEDPVDSVLATYDLSRPLPDVATPPEIHVREVVGGDVEALRRVFGEARPAVFGTAPTPEEIQGWLDSGWGETVLVAEWEGDVVGCMEHTALGRIGIPGVLPSHRRRGVGALLLRRLLEVMRAKGLPVALADTGYTEGTETAVYLYRRLSFDTSRELWGWSRTYDKRSRSQATSSAKPTSR